MRIKWLLSQKTVLLIFIFLAFLLRAGVLQATADAPIKQDDATYFKMGKLLAANPIGALKKNLFYKRAPLLPFLVATAQKVVGPEPYHSRWLIVFIGTGSVALGYGLGKRLFGERSGLAGAAILAIYPEFPVQSTFILTETPFITLSLATFLVLVTYISRPRHQLLITAGLLWSATVLTRDQALYFTPILAIWIAGSYKGELRQRLLAATGFLLMFLFGLSPWITRNLLVTGRVAFVTQREGVALFRRPGNHDPQLDLEAWCAQWEALEGDHDAQQRFALLTTLDYIRREPVEWGARKVQLFWQSSTKVYSDALRRINGHIFGDAFPPYTLAILWITSTGFVLLSAGWILGIFSAPGSPGRNLLLLWLGYSTATYIVVELLLRTRATMLAVLSLFAGYFFAHPLEVVNKLRNNPALGIIASLLLIFFLASAIVHPYGVKTGFDTCIGNFEW